MPIRTVIIVTTGAAIDFSVLSFAWRHNLVDVSTPPDKLALLFYQSKYAPANHCKLVDCVHFVDNSSSALFEHFLLDFAALWDHRSPVKMSS
jgi:hypothetical protein